MDGKKLAKLALRTWSALCKLSRRPNGHADMATRRLIACRFLLWAEKFYAPMKRSITRELLIHAGYDMASGYDYSPEARQVKAYNDATSCIEALWNSAHEMIR